MSGRTCQAYLEIAGDGASSFEDHVCLAELVASSDDDAAIDLMGRRIASTREHYPAAAKARDAEGVTATKGRRRATRR
nr:MULTISPECIES: hypothetical protein [Sinorhizobium]